MRIAATTASKKAKFGIPVCLAFRRRFRPRRRGVPSPVVARPAPKWVRSPLCQEEEEGARNHEHRDSGDKDPVTPPEVAVDSADQDEDRGHHREQGQEWMRPHTRRHLIPPPIAAARQGRNMLYLPCLLYTSPSPRDRQNLVCRLLL